MTSLDQSRSAFRFAQLSCRCPDSAAGCWLTGPLARWGDARGIGIAGDGMDRTGRAGFRVGVLVAASSMLAVPLVALATNPAAAALTSRTLTGTGDLVLRADNNATTVGVGYWDQVIRVAVAGGPMTEYPRAQVRRVLFYGGSGNDEINAASLEIPVVANGGGGDDVLLGGSGADQLIGGAGGDTLRGNGGDDTLIAIDNGTTDTVIGGSGRDAIWTDVTGNRSDTVTDLAAEDMDNAISAFANAGADRTLDGDAIADPGTTGGRGYASFAGGALFPVGGPTGRDPRQGGLSDCKTMSALSAIPANTASGRAWPVRGRVADFGDGTYGVRLADTFYRIDPDFPVGRGGAIAYAKLTTTGALWPALVEKALAYFESPAGAPSYAALNSGGSVRVFSAFGSADTGSPKIKSFASSANDLGSKLFAKWNAYQNVTISLSGGHTTRLVDRHAYTLWQVKRNRAGRVTAVVLRNPWGTDTGNRRPGYTDAHPNDGIVTVTPAQIYAGKAGGRVNWGSRIL